MHFLWGFQSVETLLNKFIVIYFFSFLFFFFCQIFTMQKYYLIHLLLKSDLFWFFVRYWHEELCISAFRKTHTSINSPWFMKLRYSVPCLQESSNNPVLKLNCATFILSPISLRFLKKSAQKGWRVWHLPERCFHNDFSILCGYLQTWVTLFSLFLTIFFTISPFEVFLLY